MESWDDKILADKLNNLQDLPAGYSPNLFAKWELVEASLPTDKKRHLVPLLIRWSVAAAVLLAIGLLWVNNGKKEAAGLAVKEQVVEPTIVFQPKQSVENKQVSTDAHPSHPANTSVEPAKQLTHQAPPPTMTIIPVRGDTNWGSSDEETAMKAPLPTVDSTASIVVKQNSLATAIEEKPRPVKKKIYQRDFNDGVLAMDTGFAPASRQHFSIQLKPFTRKTDDGEVPTHRLQLKQAL